MKYEIGEVVSVWAVGVTRWARAEVVDTLGPRLKIVGGDGAILEHDDWVVIKRDSATERQTT